MIEAGKACLIAAEPGDADGMHLRDVAGDQFSLARPR